MVKTKSENKKTSEESKKDKMSEMLNKYHIMLILAVIISIGAIYVRSLSMQEEFLAYDVYYHFYNIKSFITEGFTNFHPLSNAPFGSQIGQSLGLYMVPVIIYKVIGIIGISTKDFFFMYPALIGGFSVLTTYLFTQEAFDKKTGLIAAIILAVSMAHLSRTKAGYFRGDPVFLAFFMLALYTIQRFWRVNIKQRRNIKYIWGGIATIAIFLSFIAWSGSRYGIGVIFLFLGIYNTYIYVRGNRKEIKDFSIHMYPITLGALILTYLSNFTGLTSIGFSMFRLSIIGLIGLAIYSGAMYYLLPNINELKFASSDLQRRAGVWLGVFIIGIVISWVYFGKNPFSVIVNEVSSMMSAALGSTKVYETVQELAKTSWSDVKSYYSITKSINAGFWVILSLISIPIMIWNIIKDKKPRDNLLALVLYTTSIFFMYLAVRFLFLASIAVAIGSAIVIAKFYDKGISWFLSGTGKMSYARKIAGIVIIALLVFPSATAAYDNASNSQSPVINTWKSNLDYLREETPENSIAGSWWDYGYWIETIGERRAVADGGHARDRDYMLARLFTGHEIDVEQWQMDYFMVNLESMVMHPTYGGGKFLAIEFLGNERDSMQIKSLSDAPYVLFPRITNNTYAIQAGGSTLAMQVSGQRAVVKAGQQNFTMVVRQVGPNTRLAQGKIGTFIVKDRYSMLVSQKALNYLYTDLALLNGIANANFQLVHTERGAMSMGRAGNYPTDIKTFKVRPFAISQIEQYNGTDWEGYNATKNPEKYRMFISAFGRDIENADIMLESENKTQVLKRNVNIDHKNETENPIEFTANLTADKDYKFYLEQKGPVGLWDDLPKIKTENWSSNRIKEGDYEATITVDAHVRKDFIGEDVNAAIRGTIDNKIVYYDIIKEDITVDNGEIETTFNANINVPKNVLNETGESKRLELIFESNKRYDLGNLRAH